MTYDLFYLKLSIDFMFKHLKDHYKSKLDLNISIDKVDIFINRCPFNIYSIQQDFKTAIKFVENYTLVF